MKSHTLRVIITAFLCFASGFTVSCRKPKQAATSDLQKAGYSLTTDDAFRASAQNEVEILKQFAKSGYDLSTKNQVGDTLLHASATSGAQEAAEYLLDRGLAIDTPGAKNRTPLMAAVVAGQSDMAAYLLRQGADPRAKDSDGYTPLMLAVREGQAAPVEELAAFNREGLDSALLLAALIGKTETIDTLTNYGASVYARMEDGRTPLMIAAQNGHAEAVNLLLDIGSSRFSTDEQGNTAADFATQAGHPEIAATINNTALASTLTLQSPEEIAATAAAELPQNPAEPGELNPTLLPEAQGNHPQHPATPILPIEGATIAATTPPAQPRISDPKSPIPPTSQPSALSPPPSAPAPSPLIMRGYKETELPIRVQSVSGQTASIQLGSRSQAEPLALSPGQTIPGSQLTVIRVSHRMENSKLNFGEPTEVSVVEVRDQTTGRTREWISGTTATAHDPIAIVEDAASGKRYTATPGQHFTSTDGTTWIVSDVRPNQVIIENTATGQATTIPLHGPKG